MKLDLQYFAKPTGETEEIFLTEEELESMLSAGSTVEPVSDSTMFIETPENWDTVGNEEVYLEDDFAQEYVEEFVEEEGPKQYVETIVPNKPSKRRRKKDEFDDFDDDDDDDDDEDDEDGEDEGFLSALADKAIYLVGAMIVLVIAIFGVAIATGKFKTDNAVDMEKLGLNLAEVEMIGGEGLTNVFGKAGARLTALYDAQSSYEYDEVDEETGLVNVNLTLTSILKDLKIKMVNRKNKLIANVPFEVEVTDPNGNTTSYTDDDKDGMIYLSDLSGGTYKVKLKALEGFDELYSFECDEQSLDIKTQLEYKKVDVSNEIKKESQVDAKKEDSKVKETTVESKLKDTVEYVISAKILTSDASGYKAIDKGANIADPINTISFKDEAKAVSRFRKLASTDFASMDDPTIATGEQTTFTVNMQSGYTRVSDITWSSNCPNGTYTAAAEGGSDTVTAEFLYTIDGEAADASSGEQPTYPGSVSATVTITGSTPTYSPGTIGVDPSTINSGETATLSHSGGEHVSGTPRYEIVSGPGSINGSTYTAPPTVTEDTNVRIKGIVTYDNGNTADTNEVTVTVKKPFEDKTSMDASVSATTIGVGKTAQITISSVKDKNGNEVKTAGTTQFAYVSSDNAIASVDNSGKITGNKVGTATITVTASGGDINSEKAKKSFTITVGSTGSITLNYKQKTVLYGGDTVKLVANVSSSGSTDVLWSTDNEAICTVAADGTLTPTGEGSCTITCKLKENENIKAVCVVYVQRHPKLNNTTKLLDKNGNVVYVYDAATKTYREATYADYYTASTFYQPIDAEYKYNGWWTMGGKTYYYDKNGKKVTGEQVILGAKYNFAGDGSLQSGTGTFGIDVSKWNGTIDWGSVAKSGVSYAIIRCGFRGSTVGGLVEDAKFAINIKNATAAGLKVGIYFFTQATNEVEAIEEASMAIGMVSNYNIAYPIFIDVESAGAGCRAENLTKEQRTGIIKAFCQTIANSGYTAGVYANKTWFTNYINTSELTQYKIWLAQYASSPTYTATRYDLWQYTSEGKISGISGNVDLDLSYMGY